MDKNTLIGFGLIALILIGFSLFNRPSKKELAKRQHERDSIAYIQQIQRKTDRLSKEMSELVAHKEEQAITDEQLAEKMQGIYGAFSSAAIGQNEFVVLENDLLRLTFQTEGGKLYKAELKKYKTYGDSLNYLSLFEDKEAAMNFTFVTKSNRILNTGNLFFTPQPIVLTPDSAQVLTMRLMTDSAAYLDFVYTLPQNNYMLQFDITPHQMQQVLALNATSLEMNWSQLIPQQERGRKFEERYATLQYMYKGGDIENLSESKQVKEDVNGRLKWIAYKDQFFSTVLIADGELYSAQLTSTPMEKNSGYIKAYQTRASLAFDPSGTQSTKLRMYLGPNHYNTLKAYDKGKEKSEKLYLKSLVPLGWKIVSWINMWLVIPMFDLFMSWGMHIGWVILLMTIVIKLIILPFTFQSYRSSAKMRVLKPQVDAINEKYPADKMQERQQATMALYQKAGASPMSGCLPMLFQFPVLMAMFWFFPTAIELRGQSLFWADDLSTYDAILTWNRNIPVISWIFGNHLSLFCLLMTVTNLIYTWINMQSQNTGNDPAAKMMRWMMYLMPLMFMYIFNDYAAGLSYYYFLSLLITIIQTYIFRLSINDEKLLKQMEARAAKNANKPKKSGLMARLEKMQREQQQYMREQAKRGRR